MLNDDHFLRAFRIGLREKITEQNQRDLRHTADDLRELISGDSWSRHLDKQSLEEMLAFLKFCRIDEWKKYNELTEEMGYHPNPWLEDVAWQTGLCEPGYYGQDLTKKGKRVLELIENWLLIENSLETEWDDYDDEDW